MILNNLIFYQKKSKSLPKFSSSSVRISSHFFLLFKLHLHQVLLPNLVIINSSYDLLSHVHYYMYMIVIPQHNPIAICLVVSLNSKQGLHHQQLYSVPQLAIYVADLVLAPALPALPKVLDKHLNMSLSFLYPI